MKKFLLVLVTFFTFSTTVYAIDIKNLYCYSNEKEIFFQFSASTYDSIFHQKLKVKVLGADEVWYETSNVILPTFGLYIKKQYKMNELTNVTVPITNYHISTNYQVLEIGNCS